LNASAIEAAARLARLGAPIDIDALLAGLAPGQSIGRPQLAAALVRAGHAASIADAFNRYLGEGRPAYVPRRHVTPEEAVAVVVRAGGLAALAHPALLGDADLRLIERLARAGLAAVEAYHPEHDARATARYRDAAARLGLLVTGGSDYHGPSMPRAPLGGVTLPPADFARLEARLAALAAAEPRL
jgi:predicted metal-dependent phosphoesterase TrpH